MAHKVTPLIIDPPLLNSANPWCTTLEQLQDLYASPYTGAVTTRTSLLNGFPHNESIHQFAFYDPTTHQATTANPSAPSKPSQTGSLNTLGYSPKPLAEYLSMIKGISNSLPSGVEMKNNQQHKPFIISITGTPAEVIQSYRLICKTQSQVRMRLAMEVNLSCPNIPSKPPPAYTFDSLLSYLSALKVELHAQLTNTNNNPISGNDMGAVPIGIKTPPYTYHDQFVTLVSALLNSATSIESKEKEVSCPISFITATNTLGSSLLLSPNTQARIKNISSLFRHTLTSATGPGTGIGGLAGAPLHPLALGNVYTIRTMLDQHKELSGIQIIGVGGVEDGDGYRRMRAVGASAVAVGTALGRKGVDVFREIKEDMARKHSGDHKSKL